MKHHFSAVGGDFENTAATVTAASISGTVQAAPVIEQSTVGRTAIVLLLESVEHGFGAVRSKFEDGSTTVLDTIAASLRSAVEVAGLVFDQARQGKSPVTSPFEGIKDSDAGMGRSQRERGKAGSGGQEIFSHGIELDHFTPQHSRVSQQFVAAIIVCCPRLSELHTCC